MSICDLARPEIRELVPYDARPPAMESIRLNANEAPVSPYSSLDSADSNRYPELRPRSLQSALATLYGVDQNNLCPTRGSSEGIDLLVRAFCRAYRDNVVILPPTFEMYSAYAAMQAADVRSAPLNMDRGFAVDWQALADQCDENTRIVFLCSPNNPTGNIIPRNEILEFAESRAGKTIVIVDEAYIEFSGRTSLSSEINNLDNLVVLRTLSKAYALAGARCGAVLACDQVVELMTALMSPYALSTPVTQLVLAALEPDNHAAAEEQIAATKQERDKLRTRLGKLDVVDRVWPGYANFLLVRFTQPERVRDALAGQNVLIRGFNGVNSLQDCARITIGMPDENNRLVAALTSCGSDRA